MLIIEQKLDQNSKSISWLEPLVASNTQKYKSESIRIRVFFFLEFSLVFISESVFI